ncbi:putative selenate ABC transporter substrate-binding protein [Rugamonas sp.]|uniref:putative selenate ABC transporter substrate-binding protein n=1 Tax=Rugamonas sp. TaxID=1926287 RepID=UPI0025F3AB7D|nr:putative selenate ABC transporter substrate-binding protein [Rugamonas sp.]
MKTSPMRTLKTLLTAAATAGLLLAAHAPAQAQQVFRVSAIPDEAPTELQRKFKPLGEYLEKKIGMKVEFTPVTDYAASVEALINHKVDMVWFGGFTFVQANDRSHNQITPLVQRTEDAEFHSVFITTRKDINKLEDLKGKTFSFGSESSTSGHLMPRSFLLAAHVNPDADMKRIAFSGAHDATVAAVAGGKVDAGALNISVWDKLVAEHKVDPAVVRVFYTTPGYFDYNWSVRTDMNADLKKKISDAFLALDAKNPQDKAILDLQRTVKFIPTKAENYVAIEAAAQNAGLLKK